MAEKPAEDAVVIEITMKKICLSVIGLFLLFVQGFSQAAPDTSEYRPHKLTFEEANLVSSYYVQDGNHSAIQGGIGSEHVTDLANGLEVKFAGWDAMQRKNSLTAGFGLDYHTAASQAWISKTGASRRTDGLRIYPSLDWTRENETKGSTIGCGIYYSSEFNYKSFGLNATVNQKTKNNGEFGLKLNAYLDQVRLIYPSEFEPAGAYTIRANGEERHPDYGSAGRQTYTASFSFTQVVNTRMQGAVLLDLVDQEGYLGLPFHRVYFTDGTDSVEKLPSHRFKVPVGLRLNYFLGDNVIFRGYYRYYMDSWGLRSHTASLETVLKVTPFFSVTPFYRYYVQTAADYFAPYETHVKTDAYYSSNYALAAFTSHYFGGGVRLAPPKGLFGSPWKMVELRYGHYTQTVDLVSNVVSVNLQFK
jgi:hypothetical protein